jgi:hypothetical protein
MMMADPEEPTWEVVDREEPDEDGDFGFTAVMSFGGK